MSDNPHGDQGQRSRACCYEEQREGGKGGSSNPMADLTDCHMLVRGAHVLLIEP